MRNNNCDVIRRELDELMLEDACSAGAAEHLKACSACREFHQTQTKLRRMVGSLGTVAAPADFDFRLRARLASGPGNGAFHYWPVLQRSLAVVAVMIVFVFGVVVVWNFVNQRPAESSARQENPPVRPESSGQTEATQSQAPMKSEDLSARDFASPGNQTRSERPVQKVIKSKRTLTAIDSSMQRAEVISASEAFGDDAATVFSIDASLQPFKLSLDDGRGNARTISVPTIRFGSQKMLPNGDQLARKGIW